MAESRIALAVDRGSSFGREAIHGLIPIAHRHGWKLDLIDPERGALAATLRRLRPDGVVIMISRPSQDALCARLGVPVVNIGQLCPGSTLPHVGNDDRAIGAMAAAHLLERGRRHLFAIGDASQRMQDLRIAGFRQAAHAAGCDCEVLAPALLPRRLAPAIRRLGEPAGIFAIGDGPAAWALSLLVQAGVAVPERAAVVGVDNDDLCCRLSQPELSSVAVARREIGQAAGEVLAGLLAGGKPAAVRFIAPLGLVVRASSDHWAVADPELAAACALIRARAHLHLTPDDVVAAVPLSRSTLQRRFHAAFGQTLRAAIRSARVAQARRLLVDSDDKLAAVARRAGFAHAAQLVHHFRQAEGMTPETWRRRIRNG